MAGKRHDETFSDYKKRVLELLKRVTAQLENKDE